MRLLLSSDTLPEASLDDLLQACRRRALGGLELSVGARQAHGLDEHVCPLHQHDGGRCVPEAVTTVAWLRLPRDASLVMLMIWSGAAHQMKAGLLLQAPVLDPPSAVNLALAHGPDPARAADAASWARRHDARTCLDLAPGLPAPAMLDRVLDATLPTLAHVRLPGCGPEADDPRSDAVGGVLTRLALRGYAGTISLVPSPWADAALWRRWLLEQRGWGCGTAAAKRARRHTPPSTPTPVP